MRIALVGNSGSGKSTLARRIARELSIPGLELDSVFHQPGWAERDLASFRRIVADFVAGERWVVDGNYLQRVGDLVWARADTVVWLDLPRHVVMRQMIRRTVTRAVTRQELWNGNRERARDVLRWDPERSIIRWAWTQHARYHQEFVAAFSDPRHARLRTVRLQTHRAADQWLQTTIRSEQDAGVEQAARVDGGLDGPHHGDLLA